MPKKEFYRITVDGIPYVVEVELYTAVPRSPGLLPLWPPGCLPTVSPICHPGKRRAEGANSSPAPL